MENIQLEVKKLKSRALKISAIGYVLCVMMAVLNELKGDEFNAFAFFVFGLITQLIILSKHSKYYTKLFNTYDLKESDIVRISSEKQDIAKKVIIATLIVALLISNMNPFAVIIATYSYLWIDSTKLMFAINNDEVITKLPKRYKRLNAMYELKIYTVQYYADMLLHVALIIGTSFILRDIFSLTGFRLRREIEEVSYSLSYLIVVVLIVYTLANIIIKKQLSSEKDKFYTTLNEE